MGGAGIGLTDVFPGGTMLKRDYGEDSFSLVLWHFAYNNGESIELVRLTSEIALDLAWKFWSEKLESGDMPTTIEDVDGIRFERRWYHLKVKEPNQDTQEDS